MTSKRKIIYTFKYIKGTCVLDLKSIFPIRNAQKLILTESKK